MQSTGGSPSESMAPECGRGPGARDRRWSAGVKARGRRADAPRRRGGSRRMGGAGADHDGLQPRPVTGAGASWRDAPAEQGHTTSHFPSVKCPLRATPSFTFYSFHYGHFMPPFTMLLGDVGIGPFRVLKRRSGQKLLTS